MKKYYIGRIKLSKEDSEQWLGNPPFVYVEKAGVADRSNIRSAILFNNKEACRKALKETHTIYGHEPESKMEIMTVSISVDKIEEI